MRWLAVSFFIIGVLGAAYPLDAQQITFVRSALHTGWFSAVDISGDTAYCVGDHSLAIFYYTNPDTPVYIGGLAFSSEANDIKVSGHYAYVSLGGLYSNIGLEIIDVSNASNPTVVGEYDRVAINAKISISGNYLYLTDDLFGIQILNISDPLSPQFVSEFDTPGEAMGIFVKDTLAYVADDNRSLQIEDISDPVNPSLLGNYITQSSALDVFAAGNYAYIAEGFADITPGLLEIVNISDPTQLSLEGSFDTLGYFGNIIVADSMAFFTVGEEFGADFLAVNISDPANPTLLGSIHGTYGYDGFSIANQLAVVGGFQPSLQILDLTNPSAPLRRGTYYRPGEIMGVCASGRYAYVAAGSDGLWIASVSGNEDALSHLNFGGLSEDLCISGDYCFVANAHAGLKIIDISNPLAPENIGNYTSFDAQAVAVRGNLAYLAGLNSQLGILNVSNPQAPVLVGSCSIPGNPSDIAIQGDYAYLAAYQNGGLQIVDVSSPANPAVVGGCDTPGYAMRVFVDGNCAFIADDYNGLQIVDISDPTAPQIIGNYRINDNVVDMATSGDDAFVLYKSCDEESNCTGGIQMLNISYRPLPILVQDYPLPSDPKGIFLDGDLIYVADHKSVEILHVEGTGIKAEDNKPLAFALYPNYPNPFNARTTIRYDLPKSSMVTIDIYNILGQKISALLSGQQEAGAHAVVWDAPGVPSGIYFYHLKANEFSEIRKMILLK